MGRDENNLAGATAFQGPVGHISLPGPAKMPGPGKLNPL